jgi:hypothetical protein
MSEACPPYKHRRTAADVAIEFAEELRGETNPMGRVRHESLSDVPTELIGGEVSGIEYPRTAADETAELEASAIEDDRWKNFGPA